MEDTSILMMELLLGNRTKKDILMAHMDASMGVNDTNASHSGSPMVSDFQRRTLAWILIVMTSLSTLGNFGLLFHIVYRKLFRNFVSTHFIAHLMLTNLITCLYPIPVFVYSLYNGDDLFKPDGNVSLSGVCVTEYSSSNETLLLEACKAEAWRYDMKLRTHGFFFCALWVVTFYMVACIAGVHMITFARIHYDQLFGLSPHVICALAWLVGFSLGMPVLTNKESIRFDPNYYHCLWKPKETFTYNYFTYLLLLGTMLPISLTYYAYIRILTIFYHAPLVFQALGLFRSRYLIFTLLITVLCQGPFYITFLARTSANWLLFPILMYLAYAISLFSPFLYGLSLFLMKEDDIALTHRARRQSYSQVPHYPTASAAAHV